MEGNFRIVQLSELNFVIEKECVEIIKFPWYTFKKPKVKSQWFKVDQNGNLAHQWFLPREISYYKTSDLKVAQERLKRIKKYPIFFSE